MCAEMCWPVHSLIGILMASAACDSVGRLLVSRKLLAMTRDLNFMVILLMKMKVSAMVMNSRNLILIGLIKSKKSGCFFDFRVELYLFSRDVGILMIVVAMMCGYWHSRGLLISDMLVPGFVKARQEAR